MSAGISFQESDCLCVLRQIFFFTHWWLPADFAIFHTGSLRSCQAVLTFRIPPQQHKLTISNLFHWFSFLYKTKRHTKINDHYVKIFRHPFEVEKGPKYSNQRLGKESLVKSIYAMSSWQSKLDASLPNKQQRSLARRYLTTTWAPHVRNNFFQTSNSNFMQKEEG